MIIILLCFSAIIWSVYDYINEYISADTMI